MGKLNDSLGRIELALNEAREQAERIDLENKTLKKEAKRFGELERYVARHCAEVLRREREKASPVYYASMDIVIEALEGV